MSTKQNAGTAANAAAATTTAVAVALPTWMDAFSMSWAATKAVGSATKVVGGLTLGAGSEATKITMVASAVVAKVVADTIVEKAPEAEAMIEDTFRNAYAWMFSKAVPTTKP